MSTNTPETTPGHNWIVWIDYNAEPGHHNGVAMRVWLTKPDLVEIVAQDSLAEVSEQVKPL